MISKVIPSYAKDFKKEYLFIFDIIKRCEKLLKKIDQENVFNSSQAKNLIIYFENLDYFKDINNFYFKHEDVSFIEYLESKLEENMDLFFNLNSYKFDQEKYDNDDFGFKDFFESFTNFNDKIKVK